MRYSLDIDLQIRRVLPTFKRTLKRISWLNVVLTPIKTIYNDFIVYRSSQLNELSYNNQTAIFAYALNDAFDVVNRGISINNTFDDIPQPYIFQKLENERQIYIHQKSENEEPVYIYTEKEYGSVTHYFVNVPISLQVREEEIITLIEKYNHVGMNYEIKFY